MRRVSLIVAGMLAVGTATAQAQPLASTDMRLSAAFTTGVTAGVGGMFGGDLVWRLNLSWDVYIEGGRMLNTKTSEMDAAAAVVSQYLGAVSGKTATADVKQPVNYFDAGLRYKFPTTGRVQPYVAVGAGGGKVQRRASFQVNGADVTAQLAAPPYGVQLGGDLSGSENGAIFTLGAGAQLDFGRRLFVDASYRFGRVFLTGGGLNTNRVQFGMGARF